MSTHTDEAPDVTKLIGALSAKRQKFVFEYVKDFNASAAARRAGYAEKSARKTAWEIMRCPKVKAAIEAHLGEYAMTAAECVKHLADWGRGTVEPFIDDQGAIDLTSESARQNIKLVKKITQTSRVTANEDGELVTEVKRSIELHDAKDAVKETLRLHGKLTEKVEHKHTADAEMIAALLGVKLKPEDGDGFEHPLGEGD